MEQKNLILGFDFGEKYSQFCCYDRGTHTAVSIPVKEGEEAVEFPTAIAKKRNEETWKTGPDADHLQCFAKERAKDFSRRVIPVFDLADAGSHADLVQIVQPDAVFRVSRFFCIRSCFALVDEKKQQEDTTWNRKI